MSAPLNAAESVSGQWVPDEVCNAELSIQSTHWHGEATIIVDRSSWWVAVRNRRRREKKEENIIGGNTK